MIDLSNEVNLLKIKLVRMDLSHNDELFGVFPTITKPPKVYSD